MSTTYQQERTEIQRQIDSANAKKRAQELAASAPQREIDALQAQLAGIARQEQIEAHYRLTQENSNAVGRVFELHRAVIIALEKGDIPGAQATYDEASAAWYVARDLTAQVMQSAGIFSGIGNAARACQKHGIAQAYGVGYSLMEWIDKAPDAKARQARRGLTFAVAGELYDPRKGINPLEDYIREHTAF